MYCYKHEESLLCANGKDRKKVMWKTLKPVARAIGELNAVETLEGSNYRSWVVEMQADLKLGKVWSNTENPDALWPQVNAEQIFAEK